MTRMVYCQHLGREAEGLPYAPWPGELGKRIFEHISRDAWNLWLQQQTMLINEYRLSPLDPRARTMLVEEMEKFLFAGGNARPPGYKAPPED